LKYRLSVTSGCGVVQRATAMSMVLWLTRRVNHMEDSAAVWTESLVAAVITVFQATMASRPQDACVRNWT